MFLSLSSHELMSDVSGSISLQRENCKYVIYKNSFSHEWKRYVYSDYFLSLVSV